MNKIKNYDRELQQQTGSSRRISEIEDKSFEITQLEGKKGMKKIQESLQDLWDTTEQTNIHRNSRRRKDKQKRKLI